MNRIFAAALIAAALTLTGCTATPDAAPSAPASETQTPTPEPTDNTEWFLRLVAEQWHGSIPTDHEILKYGANGCAQLRAGLKLAAVDVIGIKSDDDAWNNQQVVNNLVFVCGEYAIRG